jgi:hypothetical protein
MEAKPGMKKVCMLEFPPMGEFHGYLIDSIDPRPYFPQREWPQICRKLQEAKFVDEMYRDRYPPYMNFVADFVDKFERFDLLIFATYNPVHPEVLHARLKGPIKILGFTDDPHSTYVRGIPYLWACDGAFYISPSYNHQLLFADAFRHWGFQPARWLPVPVLLPEWSSTQDSWWPLAAPRAEALRRGHDFFRRRDIDLIYIGKVYDSKVRRLARLKREFGNRLKVYGRWKLHGYVGFLRWMRGGGRPAFWHRVRSLAPEEKGGIYDRARIGFNMHLSDIPSETGNARMYEVTAHGAMLLCDKAGLDAHKMIFEPDKEAVFYDSMEDAIDKIHYYLEHEEEREAIARAGFARVHRDYDCETHLKALLDWAAALPRAENREGQLQQVQGFASETP